MQFWWSRQACAGEKKRYDMTTNDFPPQLVLQQLIQGFEVTQCIYVAAKLGIADLLQTTYNIIEAVRV
jgi:hypothetical protein